MLSSVPKLIPVIQELPLLDVVSFSISQRSIAANTKVG